MERHPETHLYFILMLFSLLLFIHILHFVPKPNYYPFPFSATISPVIISVQAYDIIPGICVVLGFNSMHLCPDL